MSENKSYTFDLVLDDDTAPIKMGIVGDTISINNNIKLLTDSGFTVTNCKECALELSTGASWHDFKQPELRLHRLSFKQKLDIARVKRELKFNKGRRNAY